MKWPKIFIGSFFAILVFSGTLYLLLRTFVKRPETSTDLSKVYTYITRGDEKLWDIFFVGPGARVKIKLLRGKDVIYDQSYVMDKYMMRGSNPDPKATQHAIFGGCSFTWGEGLPPEEAISAQFQKLDPAFQGYNHSFPGGGLQSLLRYHDFFSLREAVSQESGYFFYTFIPTHLERFYLRYNFLRLFPEEVPVYKIQKGDVNLVGKVKDQEVYHTFKKAFDAGLGDTLINTQDPLKWEEQELADYTLAIEKLKEIYLRNFPKGTFYVLFHPLGNPPPLKERLKFHLKSRGINFIDLAHEFGMELYNSKLTYDDMIIKYDGHPNAKANEFGARALQTFLKKAGQKKK